MGHLSLNTTLYRTKLPQSNLNYQLFRHIVLGVFYNGKFGAIGLSRRDTLMYKSLKYEVGLIQSSIVMGYLKSFYVYSVSFSTSRV